MANEILKVPIEMMLVDDDVQRDFSETNVKRIMDKFNLNHLGIVTVSKRRNGYYYIVDGQHRVEALNRLGYTSILCDVHHNLSKAEEAELFLSLNRNRRNPTALDNFKVRLAAQDEIAIEINKILNLYNLKISRGYVESVRTLEQIYAKYGSNILDSTIRILYKTWGNEAIKGDLVRALAAILKESQDKFSETHFNKRLSNIPFGLIYKESMSMSKVEGISKPQAYAQNLLYYYNRKLKPEDTLNYVRI